MLMLQTNKQTKTRKEERRKEREREREKFFSTDSQEYLDN